MPPAYSEILAAAERTIALFLARQAEKKPSHLYQAGLRASIAISPEDELADPALALARRVLRGGAMPAYKLPDGVVYSGRNHAEAVARAGGKEVLDRGAEPGWAYKYNQVEEFVPDDIHKTIAPNIPGEILWRTRESDKRSLLDDLMEHWLADKYRKLGQGS